MKQTKKEIIIIIIMGVNIKMGLRGGENWISFMVDGRL
jgi:hypothetical protein